MAKQIIYSADAPAPIGPYSQAVSVSGSQMLFVSGQIAAEVAVAGTIEDETRHVMQNIGAILQAAGLTYSHIVKASIFVKNLDNFSAINAVYGEFFPSEPPARETVEVSRLPKDVHVEISVIAIK